MASEWEARRLLIAAHRKAAAAAAQPSPAPPPDDHRFEWVPTLPRQVCARCHAETDVIAADGGLKRLWWVAGVGTAERPACLALSVLAPPEALATRTVVDAELVDETEEIVVARVPRPRRPRSAPPRAARPTSAPRRPSRRPSRESEAFFEGEDAPPDASVYRAIERDSDHLLGITHADIAGDRELELIREAQAGTAADETLAGASAAALDNAARAELRRVSITGRTAADTLLRAHDRLIRMYAARFSRMTGSRHGADFDDLLQESRRGFLYGVLKFEAKHEVKLSSYAAYWMKQCMGRTLDKTRGLVVLPYNVIERAKRVQSKGGVITADALKAAGKGTLNPEIAEAAAAVWSGRDLSVYETVGGGASDEDDNGSLKIAGYLQSEQDVENDVVQADMGARRAAIVRAALAELTEREQVVARRRLMTDPPDPLEQIGRDLGMTRENARLIEEKAKEKLRLALVRAARASAVGAEVLGEVDDEDQDDESLPMAA